MTEAVHDNMRHIESLYRDYDELCVRVESYRGVLGEELTTSLSTLLRVQASFLALRHDEYRKVLELTKNQGPPGGMSHVAGSTRPLADTASQNSERN